MISFGFRFHPVTILRDSKKFLVWEQSGRLYQWVKGTKNVENLDDDKIIPVIKVTVKY